MKLNPQKNKAEFIALAALAMALTALAIDIMLPALPEIGEAISVQNENHRQYVVTAFLIGLGVSQLFFGPFSDSFGRRTTVFIGISVYMIAAMIGAVTDNFEAMITWRFIQGLGAGATRVVALSVVRDSFSGRAMAEVMSLIMMVFMVVPLLVPAIGQGIILIGRWEWIYVFMALIAFAAFVWFFLRLPETLSLEKRRRFQSRVIVGGFKIVFTNRSSLMYGLANMMMTGSLFGFLATSQQVYGELYNLGSLFPFTISLIATVMALASLINARLVGRFGMRRLSHSALLSFVALSAIWSIISYLDSVPLVVLLTLHTSIMFVFGLTGTNFNSLAMEPLGNVAGTAASVFGFMQTAGGAVLGTLMGQAYNGSILPIALGYFVSAMLAIICVLVAEKGILFRAQHQPI